MILYGYGVSLYYTLYCSWDGKCYICAHSRAEVHHTPEPLLSAGDDNDGLSYRAYILTNILLTTVLYRRVLMKILLILSVGGSM